MSTIKNEPVFDLIKSMSKAEKRNFKLYATRQSKTQDAKFLILFDTIDSMEDYDEAKILKKCPIKKEQLPNMKAHLYKQILISLRLLNVQHIPVLQIREQVDFAKILYDKGLYKQSLKILEKAKAIALSMEQSTLALEIIETEKLIESRLITRTMADRFESLTKETAFLTEKIKNISNLQSLSIRLYGLYLKLGYARSQKDLDLIVQYFKEKLESYEVDKLGVIEKMHYYQSYVWYYFIQHNFILCYKYAILWIKLFDENESYKSLMYDNYIRGNSRLLDSLFYIRDYKRFCTALEKFEKELPIFEELNNNASSMAYTIYYYAVINKHFFEGSFAEGVKSIPKMEKFINENHNFFDTHHLMLLYYKIACLYFGNNDYSKCISYLNRITSTKDPQIRRDLQCFARILTLISSYEKGDDKNLDYQVRSVYAFLMKMNDMHNVQREMMAFLKKLNSMYESDFKNELLKLHEKLSRYENHPYERRPFYYLDINSWLESKITNKSVAEIIQGKFKKSLK